MEVSEIQRLKEPEEENRLLKQMYAELSLKLQLQKEIIKKALVPVEWAGELQATYQVSIVMSCQVVCMSRTVY